MIWIRCKSYRALPISIPRKRNNPGKGATNSILTLLSCKARKPISRTLYWILRFQSHRLSATAIFVIISYPIIILKLNLKFNQISDIIIWSTKHLLQYHLWQRKHRSPLLPIPGLRNPQPWKLLQQHPETIVTLRVTKFNIFIKPFYKFLSSKMKFFFFLYLRKFGPNWRRSNRRKRWQGLGKCRSRLKYEWSIHRVS